jgi:hypothetical protein
LGAAIASSNRSSSRSAPVSLAAAVLETGLLRPANGENPDLALMFYRPRLGTPAALLAPVCVEIDLNTRATSLISIRGAND